MAGNTKITRLIGDEGIELERWGKKCTLWLSPKSMGEVSHAINTVLPKYPPRERRDEESIIEFDEEVGLICLEITRAEAATLACLVNQFSSLAGWEHQLSKALKDCEVYYGMRKA